ncbi:hypothetical protein G7B40_035420 [Aetokthonos hydrillicola Thurmond2011]|jgi:hypothetical protein|uniref:Uncharacterized protein n=1 Tax=Aetokthonos hydrillicola Thurmond2011 TaxID=2712845 RepID=A0AAP5MC04_9CYAN|nr:hypothetical protein [Aetokthonos hydrillicola]MBO3460087.1 hypothetical protein [Aetokthonos hydrillicola CCALA 1050]MBW4589514.1 hypothetical protein [Aetokthonos hydrillicola CCALA 1050]MDR9899810.1 hypothetical protein [Aetokthonos hydrillicola Thurmond2011]
MSINKKLLTSCIASIAVLASILGTAGRVQGVQSLVNVSTDRENTVAQISRDYRPYPTPKYLAESWERRRWARYNRCIHRVHFHHQWRCDYILQERNPFMRHDRYYQ